MLQTDESVRWNSADVLKELATSEWRGGLKPVSNGEAFNSEGVGNTTLGFKKVHASVDEEPVNMNHTANSPKVALTKSRGSFAHEPRESKPKKSEQVEENEPQIEFKLAETEEIKPELLANEHSNKEIEALKSPVVSKYVPKEGENISNANETQPKEPLVQYGASVQTNQQPVSQYKPQASTNTLNEDKSTSNYKPVSSYKPLTSSYKTASVQPATVQSTSNGNITSTISGPKTDAADTTQKQTAPSYTSKYQPASYKSYGGYQPIAGAGAGKPATSTTQSYSSKYQPTGSTSTKTNEETLKSQTPKTVESASYNTSHKLPEGQKKFVHADLISSSIQSL